jgi:hypothetical protein
MRSRTRARLWGFARLGMTPVAVFVLALARMPVQLQYEEPTAFWGNHSVFEPWAGYFQVFARLSFAIAWAVGNPFVTRLLAALVIAAVAALLIRSAAVVPDARVRVVGSLSLALMPIPDPGPYLGPLNAQWWIAIAVLVIALSPPRPWHYPAVLVSGFVGLAPCLVLPAFRDRRGLALLFPALIQAAILASSTRRQDGFPASTDYLWIMLVLAAVMVVARLPLRTRLAFLYLGLAVLALGAFASGRLDGQWRYLAIPGAGVTLGLASFLGFPPKDIAKR